MFTPNVTNSTERRAARRILRRRGLPTSEVHRMSYAALSQALAGLDEATWTATLEYVKAQGGGAPVEGSEGSGRDSGPPPGAKTIPGGKGGEPAEGAEGAEGQGEAGQGEGEAKGGKSGKGKGQGQGGEAPPDALEARVRQIIEEAMAEAGPQGLSKEEVRKEAEAVLKDARPVRVEVKDLPPVELEGTTHYLFEDVLKILASGNHAWLPGPAGSGKSTLGRQAATALGYSDPVPGEPAETGKRIHMTGAIETPFQLTGYRSPNGDPSTLMTPFRKAWQYGGAFIFDDVDRSNPKALAAFNEALANGHCAFPDGVVKSHPDFIVIATANTYGLGGGTDYVGASRLDKATLDRFAFLEIPYDERQERNIAGPEGKVWCEYVQAVRAACKRLGMKHLVTPRSTYKGLKLLAAGLDRSKVEAATVFAGLDAETVARVKGVL